jgi:hypothetical protein
MRWSYIPHRKAVLVRVSGLNNIQVLKGSVFLRCCVHLSVEACYSLQVCKCRTERKALNFSIPHASRVRDKPKTFRFLGLMHQYLSALVDIWLKSLCVNRMVVYSACLHKFGIFVQQIRLDTSAVIFAHKQVSLWYSFMPWECPTTTPCSGMTDPDTNGSWRVDFSQINISTLTRRV